MVRHYDQAGMFLTGIHGIKRFATSEIPRRPCLVINKHTEVVVAAQFSSGLHVADGSDKLLEDLP